MDMDLSFNHEKILNDSGLISQILKTWPIKNWTFTHVVYKNVSQDISCNLIFLQISKAYCLIDIVRYMCTGITNKSH